MLAARELPEGPVMKQLLEWIAEVENRRSGKKWLRDSHCARRSVCWTDRSCEYIWRREDKARLVLR